MMRCLHPMFSVAHCPMKTLCRCFFLIFFCCSAFSADSRQVMVGAAAVDITPAYPVRLNGYASRKAPNEGVEQKLFAKAFAMGSADRGDLTLILTVDNLGVP